VTVAVRPPLDETRRIVEPLSIELVSEVEMARAVLPIARARRGPAGDGSA